VGSSGQGGPGFVKGQDFAFAEFQVPAAIGLWWQGFDLEIGAFQSEGRPWLWE